MALRDEQTGFTGASSLPPQKATLHKIAADYGRVIKRHKKKLLIRCGDYQVSEGVFILFAGDEKGNDVAVAVCFKGDEVYVPNGWWLEALINSAVITIPPDYRRSIKQYADISVTVLMHRSMSSKDIIRELLNNFARHGLMNVSAANVGRISGFCRETAARCVSKINNETW